MSGASPQKGGLVLAGEPSVQLLPQSVRERGKVREFRRLMILLMVLALVIVGGGVAWALGRQIVAQGSLLAAQQQTDSLLAQQAEFADSVEVAELVEASLDAQELLTTTDVDWGVFYDEISDRLLRDAGVDGGVFLTTEPWQALPEEELDEEPIAGYYSLISVTVASRSLFTTAEIAESMDGMTGYLGSWISGSIEEENVYFTTISLAFDESILAQRFATGDEGEPSDDEPSGEIGDDSASTPSPVPTETEGATP